MMLSTFAFAVAGSALGHSKRDTHMTRYSGDLAHAKAQAAQNNVSHNSPRPQLFIVIPFPEYSDLFRMASEDKTQARMAPDGRDENDFYKRQ
jgi:hypothetical protein